MQLAQGYVRWCEWMCVFSLNVFVSMSLSRCVLVVERDTERRGEYLMSYLLQKPCDLIITQPLTLTLAMARRRHEVKHFLLL